MGLLLFFKEYFFKIVRYNTVSIDKYNIHKQKFFGILNF